MAHLETLPDECLLLVLDLLSPKQLIKMHQVNNNMKRLAAEKLRTKIKVIKLAKTEAEFSDCTHLGSITTDQVLVLRQLKHLYDESECDRFLNILSRCASVKSIDFGWSKLPHEVFLEAFRRCPELECIKMNQLIVTSAEWQEVLDKIGQRLVHFGKSSYNDVPFQDSLAKADSLKLATIAEKCPYIRRVDWRINWRLTDDLISAIKSLPNNCWVALSCSHNDDEDGTPQIFEDIVDELDIGILDWDAFGRRVERLSSLKIYEFMETGQLLEYQIEFAGLKRLEFDDTLWDNIDFFVAARFPRLEEIRIQATGMDDDYYKKLFQNITSVKKLIVVYDYFTSDSIIIGEDLQLPRAVIHQLKNLEHLYVNVIDPPKDNKETEELLKQLEQYVDEISSLKKLTVGIESDYYLEDRQFEKWTEGVKRLKLKQSGVEVDLKITIKNQCDDSELNPEQIGVFDPSIYKYWIERMENY